MAAKLHQWIFLRIQLARFKKQKNPKTDHKYCIVVLNMYFPLLKKWETKIRKNYLADMQKECFLMLH